jgi:four helix bundle protein
MTLRFQNFPIYKELIKFNNTIYLLSNKLPKQEQFELASQLRRASTSVILNLAEGSMKKSDKEFNRFILISVGSASEIVAILNTLLLLFTKIIW